MSVYLPDSIMIIQIIRIIKILMHQQLTRADTLLTRQGVEGYGARGGGALAVDGAD